MISKYYKKYKELIFYFFCGIITVFVNLIIYRLLLFESINYVISSIFSYFIASILSYYLNKIFVFKSNKLGIKLELVRLIKYFFVRIGSLLLDTILLVIFVEILSIDKFISKLIISLFIIIITFIFNKKIMKKKEV